MKFICINLLLLSSIISWSQNDSKLMLSSIGILMDIETSPSQNKLGVLGQNKLLIFDQEWNLINFYELPQNSIKCVFVSDESIVVHSISGVDLYSAGQKKDSSNIVVGKFNDICFDFEENNLLIAVQSKIKIYKTIDGKFSFSKEIATANVISCIQSSHSYVTVGHESGEISVFDKSNYKELKRLTGHKTRVNCINYLNNETMLVSSSSKNNSTQVRGEVIIWKISTGEIISRTNDRFKDVIMTMVEKDSIIYVSSQSQIIKFDNKGEVLQNLWDGGVYDAPTMTFFNNQLIYGYTYQGSYCSALYIRNIETGELENKISDFMGRHVWQMSFHKNDELFLHLDGKTLLVNDDGELIRSYDVPSGSNTIKFSNMILFSSVVGPKSHSLLTHYNFQKPENSIFNTNFDLGVFGTFSSQDVCLIDSSIYVINSKSLFNITASKELLSWKIIEDTTAGTLGHIFSVPQYVDRKFISNSNYFYEYGEKNHVLNIRDVFTGELMKQFIGYDLVKCEQTNDIALYDLKKKELVLLNVHDFTLDKILSYPVKPYSVYIDSNRKYMIIKIDQYKSPFIICNLKDEENIDITPKTNIASFVFSMNSEFVLTGNYVGEIEIWNCKSGERQGLIYFRMSDKLDYVIYFDNYYDGTEEGIAELFNPNEIENLSRKKNLLNEIVFKN